jgi:hypothetical protein
MAGQPRVPTCPAGGSSETNKDAHKLAEDGVRFVLNCDAEERGEPTPTTYPAIEQYVPAPA